MSMTIAAFSGSLRKESYTTKLVKAFQTHAPEHISVNIVEIGHLPFINQDLEANLPTSVKKLHETVHDADAILFVTPEYNRSYSPVLKNAIDWGSRPNGTNAWAKKPAAVAGCTPYTLGAFGAQQHLRQVMMYLDMYTMAQPEFYLTGAGDKFASDGILTDAYTQEKIEEFWKVFIAWTTLLKSNKIQ